MATKDVVLEVQDTATEDISTKHTYVLVQKNDRRGMTYDEKNNLRPDPEYQKQKNLLLRSSILWPKGKKDPFSGKDRLPGRYLIRYYDGCTTLFVDDQPKDKDTIEQLVRSTRELFFQNGYLHVYGYDAMLKTYLDWCSWNDSSEYRVPSIDAVFKTLDVDEERSKDSVSVDDIEKALDFAKNADEKKMIIHSKFLDVPEVDYRTGTKLSTKSLRVEYRKAAMNNPKRFLETFNDKSMHIRFWIEKGMENGEISTTVVPNHASWGKKGKIICDISGLKSNDVVLNKLVEFAQTEEGSEFKQQLEALYN